MVGQVTFKKNKRDEQWAILAIEDQTDGIEDRLFASVKDRRTDKWVRCFDNYRHLADKGALLMVTGEVLVEAVDGRHDDEDGEGEQVQVKISVTRLEPLSDYQGKGVTGASIYLPLGEYPPKLLSMLAQCGGPLPLTLEYRTKGGTVAKVQAGKKHGLKYSPSLAERLKAETGCTLMWTH
jgi:hypothetical protein